MVESRRSPNGETDVDAIGVEGARTHNLKSIRCAIPHQSLTVITGVSGSGKSSLAFDTIFAEGQRRYLETFSSYARLHLDRLQRPPVDAIHNLPPTLALRQDHAVSQPRSTVGVITEVVYDVAQLFACLGKVVCTECGDDVRSATPTSVCDHVKDNFADEMVALVAFFEKEPNCSRENLNQRGFVRAFCDGRILRLEDLSPEQWKQQEEIALVIDRVEVGEGADNRIKDSLETAFELGGGNIGVVRLKDNNLTTFTTALCCHQCGHQYQPPSVQLLGVDSAIALCQHCQGLGRAVGIDTEAAIPDPNKTLSQKAVEAFRWGRLGSSFQKGLEQMCRRQRVPLDAPWSELSDEQRGLVIDGDGIYSGVRGLVKVASHKTGDHETATLLAKLRRYMTCPSCGGSRLSREARAVTVEGKHLGHMLDMTVIDALTAVNRLTRIQPQNQQVERICESLERRLNLLNLVGVGYLGLSRTVRSLSAGEYQRIALAACIGRDLVGACYVLDEPTAGLHPRDVNALIKALQQLRNMGNTVVVVEHDPAIIECADVVIELGPSGGDGGGSVVFTGSVDELKRAGTPTGRALIEPLATQPTRKSVEQWLELESASTHNLKQLDVSFPIGRITAVTGVSGSGKSSLVLETLRPALDHYLKRQPKHSPRRFKHLHNWQSFRRVITIDPREQMTNARSTVLTLLGVAENVRRLLASTDSAHTLNLLPTHFGRNTEGGRCEQCAGLGLERVDMHFLPDVAVTCELCRGTGFQDHILNICFDGLNVVEIDQLTVDKAMQFFRRQDAISSELTTISDMGLGYLRLGQPVRTLSGGELQRLRIARYLPKPQSGERGGTLFLFDEPSVGLHQADLGRLVEQFVRLRDAGNTVVFIEHNLDLIASADWIIDLGPEAGEAGGEVVVAGEVMDIVSNEKSHTGRALRKRGKTRVTRKGPSTR